MLACGGVWVAHGSGNADREVGERIGLPPDDPRLHAAPRLAHRGGGGRATTTASPTRGCGRSATSCTSGPQFRADDWEQYRAVNRAVRRHDGRGDGDGRAPIVLVQDYHFALLPQLIKQARPDARVALFWHIPWPNFEAFGICPWQKEILLGLLGADLVGFHTQFHCNNFLETVERTIEGRDRVGGLHRRAAASTPRGCGRSRSAWRRRWRPPTRRPGDPARRAGRQRRAGWASASSGSTTPRDSPSACAPSSASSSAGRSTGGAWSSCRSPRRAAPASPATRPCSRRSRRPCGRSTRRWASGAGCRSSITSATTTTARSGATTGRPTSAW